MTWLQWSVQQTPQGWKLLIKIKLPVMAKVQEEFNLQVMLAVSLYLLVTYSECKFSVTMLACWNLILILDAKARLYYSCHIVVEHWAQLAVCHGYGGLKIYSPNLPNPHIHMIFSNSSNTVQIHEVWSGRVG